MKISYLNIRNYDDSIPATYFILYIFSNYNRFHYQKPLQNKFICKTRSIIQGQKCTASDRCVDRVWTCCCLREKNKFRIALWRRVNKKGSSICDEYGKVHNAANVIHGVEISEKIYQMISYHSRKYIFSSLLKPLESVFCVTNQMCKLCLQSEIAFYGNILDFSEYENNWITVQYRLDIINAEA